MTYHRRVATLVVVACPDDVTSRVVVAQVQQVSCDAFLVVDVALCHAFFDLFQVKSGRMQSGQDYKYQWFRVCITTLTYRPRTRGVVSGVRCDVMLAIS